MGNCMQTIATEQLRGNAAPWFVRSDAVMVGELTTIKGTLLMPCASR